MSKRKLPKKLETDTILEAIFEIRFAPVQPDTGDLLSALLHQKLKVEYPKLSKLAMAHLPQPIIASDPDLKYKATNRFDGEKSVLLVGNNVVTISKHRPYEGWAEFKKRIDRVLSAIAKTKLVSKVERIAVRYTNFFPTDSNKFGSDTINFLGHIGPHNLTKNICHIRTEVKSNDCISIIQLTSNAITKNSNRGGIIVDIDSQLSKGLSNFWKKKSTLINKVHNTEKEIFFGVITDKTLNELNPIWN